LQGKKAIFASYCPAHFHMWPGSLALCWISFLHVARLDARFSCHSVALFLSFLVTMVSAKTFSLALLQIGAAAAKCYRGCSPDDDALLELLSAEPDAVSFCSEFLGIGTATVESTVTPTV